MKIALYQPWIYLCGGLERSLLELISRSRHEWVVYTGNYQPESTFPEFRNHRVVELEKLSVNRNIGAVLGVALRILRHRIPLQEYDALVVWCDGLGSLVTFGNTSRPAFNICSTPLRAVYDPVYQEQALSKRGFLGRLLYHFFKSVFVPVDRLAWRRFSGVIATSSEVQERIVKGRLYADGPRMRMCYPGIDWQAMGGEVDYEKMLLVPGRIMWTKNIQLAVRAFLEADMPQDWRLVVAGFVDRKSESYLLELKELAQGDPRIVFEKNPSDERLKELYGSTAAVLFPPLNEDWGIVPLEAMARSKAVIANAAGGPLESVVDGETGWLLPPETKAWATLLASLPEQTQRLREMGAAARAHSAQYDWSHFVSGVDDAIEEWTLAVSSSGGKSSREKAPQGGTNHAE